MDNQTNAGLNMNNSQKKAGAKMTQKSSDEIKNNIKQTKDDMVETASEIGKRLQPARLVNQYLDQSTTFQFMKRHPFSLSLVAAGFALYFYERKRPVQWNMSTQDVKNKFSDMKETLSHAAETVSERASMAKDQLVHAGENIRSAASKGYEEAQDFYKTSPLAVGGIALLAGLALGWALPISESEKRLMGEKSSKLVGKAKDVLREKSQHVVDDVKDYASQNLGMPV